jgi:Leucine-rich repeat (LRR) protein
MDATLTSLTFENNDELVSFLTKETVPQDLSYIKQLVLSSSTKYASCISKLNYLESIVINKGIWQYLGKLIKRNAKLKNIIIINNLIMAINKNIDSLVNLQVLVLNNNIITKIPLSLYSMITLKELSLDDNKINHLSTNISKLHNLKYLSLKNNMLTRVPKSLWTLQGLRYLDLSCNKINKIRISKSKTSFCTKLQTLKLSSNGLTKLPLQLSKLQELSILRLDNNLLSDSSCKMLQKFNTLKVLSVMNNLITTFMIDIHVTSLENCILEELALSGNNLVALDPKIFMLPKLKYLYVCNIPNIKDDLNWYVHIANSKGIKIMTGGGCYANKNDNNSA